MKVGFQKLDAGARTAALSAETEGGVQSALLLGRGRGEIWGLVRHPIDKLSHVGVGQ